MTILLGILSVGLVLLAISFVLFRLVFDLQLSAIQKESDQTSLFRRKVNHLKKIEQTRHIRYLLLSCLMLGLGWIFFMGVFLVLVEDQQGLEAANQQLESRVKGLEHQQEQFIASIPLKNYPKEGIGLDEYEWEKLVGKSKDSSVQRQIEAAVSQQTFSYFGSYDTTVSLADPKMISLQLKGHLEDDKSKETVQKNLDAFAKEAEKVSELLAIHVQMNTSIGTEKQIVYSVNYSRESSEKGFNKKNVSEQKLKNDGGKG